MKYPNVLIDGITEAVKLFLLVLLAPLATSLVQPVIPLIITIISGGGIRRVGTECIDTDLSIIVITKYFSYEPKFNGVFPKNTLSRIKYGVYVINLNDNGTNGTH